MVRPIILAAVVLLAFTYQARAEDRRICPAETGIVLGKPAKLDSALDAKTVVNYTSEQICTIIYGDKGGTPAMVQECKDLDTLSDNTKSFLRKRDCQNFSPLAD